MAAAVRRPYVSETNYWVVKHHRQFHGFYCFHHFGQDPSARDRWREHPYYLATVNSCANYDQNSFDPDCDSETVRHFEPMVRRVLAEPGHAFSWDGRCVAFTHHGSGSAPMIRRVGFVGLGHVGEKLAGSLLRGGYELVVLDLDPQAAAPLLESGAAWASSPAEVAQRCEMVITCLPSPGACAEVVEGANGLLDGLREGSVWVEMSTTDETEVRRLARGMAKIGATAADSRVRRLPQSGEREHLDLRRLRPTRVRAVAPSTEHDGPPRLAHRRPWHRFGAQGDHQLPGNRQPGRAHRGPGHRGRCRHGPGHNVSSQAPA